MKPTDLYAPEGYSTEMIKGCECGRKDWTRRFIPDAILGLDIRPACCIHDWMYTYPATADITWKDEADRIFLNNMLRLINSAGSWGIVRRLRTTIAWVYFMAVRDLGGPSFWSGKNQSGNLVPISLWQARKPDPHDDRSSYAESPEQHSSAS